MNTFWIASLRTSFFHFEAFGNTRGEANRTMNDTIRSHCVAHLITEDEFRQRHPAPEFREVETGVPYLDGEKLCV